MSGHKKRKAAEARFIVALATLNLTGASPPLAAQYKWHLEKLSIKAAAKYRQALLADSTYTSTFYPGVL